ncbi:hypothetical protein [Xanthomarina gelatinilytica]|uniref:hypothetical protein n=1 Tax=Xanthomarina gelatinilytica TaxID=1137281 RepID=UPI003AA8A7C8
MNSLNDLIGRTVNIDIDGLSEVSEPVEMAFVITDVVIEDQYFIEKLGEQIFIKIFAEPVEFRRWDKDQQDWWLENYFDHYFKLDELKWHPDFDKKSKPL